MPFLRTCEKPIQWNQSCPVLVAIGLQRRLLQLLHLVLINEGLLVVILLSIIVITQKVRPHLSYSSQHFYDFFN